MIDKTRLAIESARRFVEVIRVDRVQIPIGSDFARTHDYAEAIVELAGLQTEVDRLTFALHRRRSHPDFEYTTTQRADRFGLEGDGWEPNDVVECHEYKDGKIVSEHWRNWERFQFHEDNHWRRRKTR